MVVLNIPQGSIEWITARLWRLTASTMSKSITAGGKLSKSAAAISHLDKLIAGLKLAKILEQKTENGELDDVDDYELKNFMSNYVGDVFKGNWHTQRGNDLEPDAVAALSDKIGSQVHDIGMCVIGDDLKGVVSCSPDGHTSEGGKFKDGTELKCPCLSTYYGYVADDVLPSSYKLQVHSSMAICEVNTWHFGAYFPGEPLFYKKVQRTQFTDDLADAFSDFRDLYSERYAEIMGKLS